MDSMDKISFCIDRIRMRNSLLPSFSRVILLALVATSVASLASSPGRVTNQELDAYWADVSRCVGAGDFARYSSLYHKDAVLVSGIRGNSEPISQALARWKAGIDATREGKVQASVEFRFSSRKLSPTTAHETGIFLYKESGEGRDPVEDYIHFEALLVKQGCRWLATMEYQKSKATVADWNALGK